MNKNGLNKGLLLTISWFIIAIVMIVNITVGVIMFVVAGVSYTTYELYGYIKGHTL